MPSSGKYEAVESVPGGWTCNIMDTAAAAAQAGPSQEVVMAESSEAVADPSKHPSGIIPKLQNIVATVNLSCKLDLKAIALRARNAEYNPKVHLSSGPHSCRMLLFALHAVKKLLPHSQGFQIGLNVRRDSRLLLSGSETQRQRLWCLPPAKWWVLLLHCAANTQVL